MTNAQAITLGVVQGLTEYLPVSSSAHLVLVPNLLGWQFLPKESFIFDVLVQLGTLVGVLIYFMRPLSEVSASVLQGIRIKRPLHDQNARIGWMVMLASIPAAIIGLLFKDQFSDYFSSPLFCCLFLMLTGIILIAAEAMAKAIKDEPGRADAILIGFAQSMALFPGISRSGATIAAGMARGLSRRDAAKFSFLMSIPIMVGASAVALMDLLRDIDLFNELALPLSLGFVSAAISGYLVIKWFMEFLSTKRLIWFAAYCLVAGACGIIYF